MDVEGVGEVVDAVGVGEVVDAVGVGEELDAEGASDAVPGVTRPFNIGLALAGALFTGEATSLLLHAERTSAPARRSTVAMALPERRVVAVTSRIAHPQFSAFQRGKKPVIRNVSGGGGLLRYRSQKA